MAIAPRFRGAVWLDELKHIRHVYGSAPVDQGFALLSEADRRALQDVMPVSWVEVAPVMACKNAIAKQVGMDGLAFQRAVVRAGVERTVKGVWRFLVRRLWDDALAKRLPILYSRTFEFGELRVESLGQGSASLRLVGWYDMHEYDALGLATGIETVCDLAGRRDTAVTYRRERDGAEMRFEVSWKR